MRRFAFRSRNPVRQISTCPPSALPGAIDLTVSNQRRPSACASGQYRLVAPTSFLVGRTVGYTLVCSRPSIGSRARRRAGTLWSFRLRPDGACALADRILCATALGAANPGYTCVIE